MALGPRSPLRRALRRGQQQIRHVTPVAPRAASGLVADVYAQVEHDFGLLAPPITLHSPAPEVMAASWLLVRETLIADGHVERGAKEAVAAAVSEANSCPYCVAVHSATRDALAPRQQPAGAAGSQWVPGGGPVPPHSAAALAEYVGVALTFEYLNRMANIFLPDSPLPPEVPVRLRSRAQRALGWIVAPGRAVAAGASLALLPGADVPPDAAWAEGSSRIAATVATACAAVDASTVPRAVRELVLRLLAEPEPTGELHRAALDELVGGLPGEQRVAGCIAVLTALASYRVDDGLLATYRACGGTDAELIRLTAWSSLAAARSHAWRYASAARGGAPARDHG